MVVGVFNQVYLGVESLEPLELASQLEHSYLRVFVPLPLLVIMDLELLSHLELQLICLHEQLLDLDRGFVRVGDCEIELELALHAPKTCQTVGIILDNTLFVISVLAGVANCLAHPLYALLAILAPLGRHTCLEGPLAPIKECLPVHIPIQCPRREEDILGVIEVVQHVDEGLLHGPSHIQPVVPCFEEFGEVVDGAVPGHEVQNLGVDLVEHDDLLVVLDLRPVLAEDGDHGVKEDGPHLLGLVVHACLDSVVQDLGHLRVVLVLVDVHGVKSQQEEFVDSEGCDLHRLFDVPHPLVEELHAVEHIVLSADLEALLDREVRVLFERVDELGWLVFAHELDVAEGGFLLESHAGDDVLEVLELDCGLVLEALD